MSVTGLGNLAARRHARSPRTARDAMAALFAQDGLGVALLDAGGQAVRANAALLRLLPQAAFLPVAQALPAPSGPRLQAALAAGLATEILADIPDAAQAGSARAIAVHVSPLANGGGLVVLRDMSALQQAAARAANAERLALTGQIAAGVAHDVNNLLGAIRGLAEELAADPRLAAGHAPEILSQVERGARLMRQMLALAAAQPLAPQLVSLSGAITAIAPLLRRLLGPGRQLLIDLPPRDAAEAHVLRIDPGQLDQVLINLCVNAAAAMGPAGTLRITTGRQLLLRRISFGGHAVPPGRYLSLVVEDDGAGMPPEVLARVFEPYFTTRRAQGGSGLGLATVLGILRQSGGFIAVHSAPGQGSRFSILFPRAEGQAARPDQAGPAPTSPRPRGEGQGSPAPSSLPSPPGPVILVEDEAELRLLASRALHRAGYEVLAFDSAEAALQGLALPPATGAAPCCAVSDVTLPGMDGARLVRRLRQDRPGLPAVLMSGYADAMARDTLAGLGCRCLAKPFAMTALLDEVRRVVAEAG